MGVVDYSDCVLGETYFFVYSGVVYYGKAEKEDWEDGNQPTQLEVLEEDTYRKVICNIWNAQLIYKL